MSEKPTLQTFRLMRRINLGNYEHYEVEVTIHDENEDNARIRALEIHLKTAETLGIREKIDFKKV